MTNTSEINVVKPSLITADLFIRSPLEMQQRFMRQVEAGRARFVADLDEGVRKEVVSTTIDPVAAHLLEIARGNDQQVKATKEFMRAIRNDPDTMGLMISHSGKDPKTDQERELAIEEGMARFIAFPMIIDQKEQTAIRVGVVEAMAMGAESLRKNIPLARSYIKDNEIGIALEIKKQDQENLQRINDIYHNLDQKVTEKFTGRVTAVIRTGLASASRILSGVVSEAKVIAEKLPDATIGGIAGLIYSAQIAEVLNLGSTTPLLRSVEGAVVGAIGVPIGLVLAKKGVGAVVEIYNKWSSSRT